MPLDEDDENKVIILDCEEECPYGFAMSSPKYSELCKEHIKKMKFETLRLKTKYLTKEYNDKQKLVSLEPFFIDVRFLPFDSKYELVEDYILKSGAEVKIFRNPADVGFIYHLTVPEMFLTYMDLKKLYKLVKQFEKSGETKSEIVQRWYREYGVLEYLLFDENILEINVNPPPYKTPMRIVHAKYDECISNICPSEDFLNYLATRLKINTGRPLDKAEPRLDGELVIKTHHARVAALIDPFSIYGTAYSIRSHREQPWTLSLFMDNKTVNWLFAGFISFMVTHGRSFLVAGPRGSGKTSVLGACLLEILRKYRVITIEDTQEIPLAAFQKLGYDILPLKVKSALLTEGMEIPFDSGLRTSLRLGDSCLIIGEIRSTEAKVLYEAMRVGATANVVAGTIHADTPYGVFDRVVNDLGVPPGSFKVTDLIVQINQIKSQAGDKRLRRVMRVTEVMKRWQSEKEPEFQDLLVYNPTTDQLEPTDILLNGKCEIMNSILEHTIGGAKYKDLLEDIYLRGWAKQVHLALAKGKKEYMEYNYVFPANTLFSILFSKLDPVKDEKNKEKFKKEYTQQLSKLING
jgi:archaeal flagellar protein FlaI